VKFENLDGIDSLNIVKSDPIFYCRLIGLVRKLCNRQWLRFIKAYHLLTKIALLMGSNKFRNANEMLKLIRNAHLSPNRAINNAAAPNTLLALLRRATVLIWRIYFKSVSFYVKNKYKIY
jgi:hypothetical protein